MSIETFNEQQRVIQDILNSGPQAWVLALNHMRDHRIEITQNVAVFSTELLAQAYLEACKLPKPIKVGRWVHCFRPDSILWWHNQPFSYDYQGILPCQPWIDYNSLLQDLVPPTGSWDLSSEDIEQIDEKTKELIRQWREEWVTAIT